MNNKKEDKINNIMEPGYDLKRLRKYNRSSGTANEHAPLHNVCMIYIVYLVS